MTFCRINDKPDLQIVIGLLHQKNQCLQRLDLGQFPWDLVLGIPNSHYGQDMGPTTTPNRQD
jgi:hypothetical protein